MRRKYQVLLIDAEGILRDGLCAMINLEADFALLAAIAATPALQSVLLPADPDLIIADFGVPPVSVQQTVELARTRWKNVPILVLTSSRDGAAIEAALRAGVDGYIL